MDPTNHLNIARKTRKQSRIEQLRDSLREINDIAEETRFEREIVRRYYEQHPPLPFVIKNVSFRGCHVGRPNLGQETIDRITTLATAVPRMTMREIARRLDLSYPTVLKYASRISMAHKKHDGHRLLRHVATATSTLPWFEPFRV